MKISVTLFILILAAVVSVSPAISEDQVFAWPRAGFLVGRAVNLRAGPSTESTIVARFDDEVSAGELLVTARRDGPDYPWFRVISTAFGEGWIYGKYLHVENEGPPVRRYALKIREDYGLSPKLAILIWGEPLVSEKRQQEIADFNRTVFIETLTFHGHRAVYWDGSLQAVIIEGGFMGFGDILIGMAAHHGVALLGRPFQVAGNRWLFVHERDSIEVEHGRAAFRYEDDDEEVVTVLRYRRAVYD